MLLVTKKLLVAKGISTSSKGATRWRPSLLGWRPLLLVTRSSGCPILLHPIAQDVAGQCWTWNFQPGEKAVDAMGALRLIYEHMEKKRLRTIEARQLESILLHPRVMFFIIVIVDVVQCYS